MTPHEKARAALKADLEAVLLRYGMHTSQIDIYEIAHLGVLGLMITAQDRPEPCGYRMRGNLV